MPQIKVTHQYRLLRAPEKQHHDACLDMIATAGETTRFGTLYLIDDDYMMKVGVTGQQQIANRLDNLQTGNPRPLRVVTLCFFYSREIALVVEAELKRRHAPRRAGGGSEWFDVPRDELRRDVLITAHELALNQMRAATASAAPIRPQLATYFYGLLMFDIFDGVLHQSWDATSAVIDLEPSRAEVTLSAFPMISADDQSESKRGFWDQLRRFVGF
jgi:hypothetical protein